jgi:acetylornithine deacetylase/succinyl-diaminopimelate desuccinylase-like protein
VAEKGLAWRRLVIKGRPGHGSVPYGSDNALVTAAEVVRRIADHHSVPQVSALFRAQIEALGLPDDLRDDLLDPARLDEALARSPRRLAPLIHACSHTTFSPNIMRGGVKENVIPSEVNLDVDIRMLPGVTGDDVDAELAELLGELADRVEICRTVDKGSTSSAAGTPMWEAIERRVRHNYPDADILPSLMVGGTDARFFRERGAVGYGAGLLAPDLTAADFGSRFHGHNERIDTRSLGLCTDLWLGVVQDLLG